SFRLNLTALSFLAVFVGMFLIYNTMLFTVIHRRKQLGILRCLGVTPKQIMSTALLEALTLGVLGALLGLALGIVLAQYTTQAVSKTISELYVFLKFDGVTLQPFLLLKAFGFGMLATLAATAVPAFEAASTSAATAVRRSSLESRAGKWAPRFTGLGLAWLFIAFLFYLLSENFWGGLMVALSVGFAAICFTPSLSLWLTQRLSPLSRKYAGQPGLLATRGIRAALSRTAVAIAALMLSLAMLLGMRLMITSFRATIEAWVNHILEGDVYLSASGIATAKWQAKIAPELIAELTQHPEVEAIDLYGVTEFSYRGRPIYLIAISAEVVQERLHFLFSKNEGRENWPRVRAGEVIISETFARRFRKSGGDTLVLATARGPRAFAIADVFIDYSFEQGQVMMDHTTYENNWGPSRANNLGLFLKPGADAKTYIANLRRALAGRYAVRIVSNRELRAEVRRIFDQSFALTNVMQVLTAIVAFVGIISAIMSLLMERTRELGILRAVGMSLAQLRRMVLLESGLMGAIAGAIALPTGSLFALVLVYVINLRTFDWTIALQWEPLAYMQTLGLAVLTALLAAIYPLLRLQKIPIAGAMREE
ncbi:MAG: FtsX-like permease family protein, partial [candidate division KSB1 bacterium]